MGEITKITTREEAIKLTKHSGWCTGFTHTDEHWNSYAASGDIFIYHKDGKRRPSYQVFFPNKDSHKRFEMKHVGNNLISSEKVKGLPDLCAFIIGRIGNDQFNAYLKAHERESSQTTISMPRSYSAQSLRESIREYRHHALWGQETHRRETIIEGSRLTLLMYFDSIRGRHPPQDAPSADMREIGIPSLPFAENGSFSLMRSEYNRGGLQFSGFSYRLVNGVDLRAVFGHVDINTSLPAWMEFDRYGRTALQVESRVGIVNHDILVSRRMSGEQVLNLDDMPIMVTADAVLAFHALVMGRHYSDELRQIQPIRGSIGSIRPSGMDDRHSLSWSWR